jgi:DNA-binding MarR family transcriptional regulator/GNAT superfamily N-acetyltransferase
MAADTDVATVRSFNRFYTRLLGLLDEGLLDTTYSLTEVRTLYELAQQERIELAELRERLGLDAGYLTRVLGRLADADALTKERSPDDGRRQIITLTRQGRRLFAEFDARADRQIAEVLDGLDPAERRRLVGAMTALRQLLDPTVQAPANPAVVLRPPVSGDHGWVVQRHGELYAREYRWDETFEALVAGIMAELVTDRREHPDRSAGWIAEVDGERAGCVYCCRKDDTTAKLRLLLVEPWARGSGIGSRLVDECVRFATRAGYRTLTLWTNDVLTDARRIYEKAGFQLVEEEPHHSFGHDLVGQTWTLPLR